MHRLTTALVLISVLAFTGCEREPRVSARSDGTTIEERYGMPEIQSGEAVDSMVVPVTLADGRPAQLIVPKNQLSSRRVLLRDGRDVYPVELQNPGVDRDEFVRSQPRVVARRVDQPAATARTAVEPKKKRSTKDEILIVAGSAGAGAAIGAVAGGKKGAAVGAISGGVAGLIYDLATRNK